MEDYLRESGLNMNDEEMEPFKSPEDMLVALHDFGGMRISLYFPGDIERAVSIIQAPFDVIRRIYKGYGAQVNAQGLKGRLQSLQHHETSVHSCESHRSLRTFTGYKATHLHIKLRDEEIPESRKPSWNGVIIEIQLGTLVKHVWSEIEHDLIYKPIDCQGDPSIGRRGAHFGPTSLNFPSSYRLYPKKQWNEVRKAWSMFRNLPRSMNTAKSDGHSWRTSRA